MADLNTEADIIGYFNDDATKPDSFFNQTNSVLNTGEESKKLDEFLNLIKTMMGPSLTNEGRDVFNQEGIDVETKKGLRKRIDDIKKKIDEVKDFFKKKKKIIIGIAVGIAALGLGLWAYMAFF